MANTAELLPRLDNGLLDFVIAYGSENGVGVRQEKFPGLRIGFTSFGFPSTMVLAAHPLVKLLRTNGSDANADYGEYLLGLPKGDREKEIENPPRYKELRSLNLTHVDFRGTGLELIVTRTWDNPPGLVVFIEEEAEKAGARLRYVDSYDEAVTLVKLQLGLAVLPQVFSKRRMVHAFRLTPGGRFRRWIGAYYSPRFPLSEQAWWLLTVIRHYLERFELSVRDGRPAAYPESEFLTWCEKGFDISGNWLEQAQLHYPLRLAKREGGVEPTEGN